MKTDCKIIRIAIIEDNRFIRNGWEMLFDGTPEFEVTGSYTSCEDAFKKDKIKKADIVLMDLRLPGMSGIEGIKYIKEHFPNIEILVCSAYEDDENIFRAITSGAIGFIAKKAPPKEMLNTIIMAIKGGSPITPNVARKIISLFQKQTSRSVNCVSSLTDTDIRILNRIVLGKSYATVAGELLITSEEVSNNIRNIYKKLKISIK